MRYIDKEDLEDNKFYVVTENDYKWIVRKGLYNSYIMTNNPSFNNGFKFYGNYQYREADPHEIKWLGECIKHNKLVPKPPLNFDNYDIY